MLAHSKHQSDEAVKEMWLVGYRQVDVLSGVLHSDNQYLSKRVFVQSWRAAPEWEDHPEV
jgi:hypothetical protein